MTSFLLFLLLSIFLPIFFVGVALLKKKSEKSDFSFRSYFSYELFFSEKKDALYYILRIIGALAFLTPVLSGIYGLTLTLTRGSSDSSFFLGSVALFSFIFSLMQYWLTYCSLSYSKKHLTLFFCSDAALIISSGMAAFYFLAVYHNVYLSSSLFLTIFLLLVVVVSIGVLLNPKLRDWDKMERAVKEDGSVYYIRPKRFVLPYSEWLLLLMSFVSNIAIIVGLYLISIN